MAIIKQSAKTRATLNTQPWKWRYHPLFPENGLETLDNRDILALIERYSGVKAVISGDHHPGNFGKYKGIPMITLEGMIETANDNAYGVLELHLLQLELKGQVYKHNPVRLR